VPLHGVPRQEAIVRAGNVRGIYKIDATEHDLTVAISTQGIETEAIDSLLSHKKAELEVLIRHIGIERRFAQFFDLCKAPYQYIERDRHVAQAYFIALSKFRGMLSNQRLQDLIADLNGIGLKSELKHLGTPHGQLKVVIPSKDMSVRERLDLKRSINTYVRKHLMQVCEQIARNTDMITKRRGSNRHHADFSKPFNEERVSDMSKGRIKFLHYRVTRRAEEASLRINTAGMKPSSLDELLTCLKHNNMRVTRTGDSLIEVTINGDYAAKFEKLETAVRACCSNRERFEVSSDNIDDSHFERLHRRRITGRSRPERRVLRKQMRVATRITNSVPVMV
jgi:hypothetical protein